MAVIERQAGPDYTRVAHVGLRYIKLCVLARSALVASGLVSGVRVAAKATGLAGVMGNKGAVMVAMAVRHTSFAFVCAHLAAHQHELARRNADFRAIAAALNTSPAASSAVNGGAAPSAAWSAGCAGTRPDLLSAFDHLFFVGDLNYRIDLDIAPPAATASAAQPFSSSSSSSPPSSEVAPPSSAACVVAATVRPPAGVSDESKRPSAAGAAAPDNETEDDESNDPVPHAEQLAFISRQARIIAAADARIGGALCALSEVEALLDAARKFFQFDASCVRGTAAACVSGGGGMAGGAASASSSVDVDPKGERLRMGHTQELEATKVDDGARCGQPALDSGLVQALSARRARLLAELAAAEEERYAAAGALLRYDQLRREMFEGRAFAGFREARPCFPPTYKFAKSSAAPLSASIPAASSSSNAPVGEAADACATQSLSVSSNGAFSGRTYPLHYDGKRLPAFCDRVLWRYVSR